SSVRAFSASADAASNVCCQSSRGGVERAICVAAAAIHKRHSLGAAGLVAVSRTILIETTQKADFAGSLANNDGSSEKSVGVEAEGALYIIRGADNPDFVLIRTCSHDE